MRRLRRPAAILAALIALVVAIDFTFAGIAEYRISRATRAAMDLPVDPAVGVLGVSFLAQSADGEYGKIAIRAEDLPSELFGVVTIEVTLRGLRTGPADLLNGRIEGLRARTVSTRLTLDTATVGRLLGIRDLQIRACENNSPIGEREDCGVLTGTVSVGNRRHLVSVRTLTEHDDQVVRFVPIRFETGIAGTSVDDLSDRDRELVLDRFAYTFTKDHLPLGRAPSLTFFRGGSFFVDSDIHGVTIDADLLRDIVPR